MRNLGRVIGLVWVCAAGSSAWAAGPAKPDPDWPCRQAKVGEFPLASVWEGPALEAPAEGWRNDPEIAALVAKMAQRRAPLEDVQSAVGKIAAAPDGKTKVLRALGVAFDELVRQRAEILAGLDRYGRKNREMAERLRTENESAHREPTPGGEPDVAALQKLQWDLRVFEDRRRTANYVCEAPQAIETRIGDIVKAVRAAL